MVLLVVAGYAPSLVGFRKSFLRALVEAGHSVHATAPEDDAVVRAELAGLGIGFHPVPMARAGFSPLADLRYRHALADLMRDLGVEGVFAYTHKAVIHGLRAAKAAGVRRRAAMITGLGYAFTPGGGLRRRLASLAVTSLYRSSLRHATALFFQNPDDLATFRSLGLLRGAPEPVVVAGSGIPLDEFPVQPLPSGPPVFLMLTRLLADKGVREYAAAAAEVRRVYPAVRCLLAGDLDSNPTSVSREELDGWVTSGAIEYLGRLTDVRPSLATCTTYVLPSYREGTPRSVLEALAVGRPVITTDAPGCRETVLEPGVVGADGLRRCANGYLVPVADASALAKAMMRLAAPSAPLAELAKASRRHAETKYDVRKVNAALLAAFA
jgi:glycosyltransferase involved in cell wall biosynthesis